jgi:hypothetical protein
MKRTFTVAGISALGILALAGPSAPRAAAQDPILTPIIVSEAAPIVVKAVTPKPKPTSTQKFQGYIVNANTVQVTVKAKGNDMAVQTFLLSDELAARMQQIIDKGGYQYGDKITVYYDSQTNKAVKLKGKPSRPL